MANHKRSGKFYRKNEAEVMRMLGLEPTPNSGSGWIVKEDGQNENVICQLKSTDARSMKIDLQDLQKLEYNAEVAKKLPVFAIQFLINGATYLIVRPEHLEDSAKFLETGIYSTSDKLIDIDLEGRETLSAPSKKSISSSKNAREKFREENESKFRKKVRNAR